VGLGIIASIISNPPGPPLIGPAHEFELVTFTFHAPADLRGKDDDTQQVEQTLQILWPQTADGERLTIIIPTNTPTKPVE